jgi:D-arabinose 1-dehydrogenase-like Zn-dependent alcohol dehydrogenase
LGVLLEPTTVVTKAWEQVIAVGHRAYWEPRTVLVTGAGPIGLLAALIGVQRGLDVHVLDRVETGPKPELVRALGATYHSGTAAISASTPTSSSSAPVSTCSSNRSPMSLPRRHLASRASAHRPL